MLWSAAALVIPLLGNRLIDGWNWSIGDFAFAWAFLVIMGMSMLLATKWISNPAYRVGVGGVIFIAFAGIWVMLATG